MDASGISPATETFTGKVYQLFCEDGYYYIGSTKNELRKRLFGHKKDSKTETQSNRRVYTHINKLGWDKVKIVLIEEVQCMNKQELLRKETEHITKHKDDKYCLNMHHMGPYRTHEKKNKQRKLTQSEWIESVIIGLMEKMNPPGPKIDASEIVSSV